MVRRYYVSTEWQLKAMLQEFSTLSGGNFVGNTGGFWIYRYNGMYEGIISDIYLHCSHSIGDLQYVTALVNGTTPILPEEQPPIITPSTDDGEELYIRLKLAQPVNDNDGSTGNIASKIGEFLSNHNVGYTFIQASVEGDTINIFVKKNGSITIIALCVVLIAEIIGILWTRILSYRVISLKTQADIISTTNADKDSLINEVMAMISSGAITPTEGAQLIEKIKTVYVTDIDDNNGKVTGISITAILIGGAVLYLLSKKKR